MKRPKLRLYRVKYAKAGAANGERQVKATSEDDAKARAHHLLKSNRGYLYVYSAILIK